MKKINYRVLLRPLSECPGFTEITSAELRVLVALIEAGGLLSSVGELARASGTTEARCISALALFSEIGLIAEETGEPENATEPDKDNIVYEFDQRIYEGEIDEEPSAEVAEIIRDENLSEMIDECARLFGKPSLSTQHMKMLTALHSQYELSAEYILTLASYMATKGRPNPSTLKDKAIRLYNKGIDTVEDLEKYISDCERENTADWELKRLFGIKNRNLSDAELEYFHRWCDDFDFDTEIISEAYNLSTLGTGKLSLQYMDKILSDWHDRDCKTLEDCKKRTEQTAAQLKEVHKPKKEKKKAEAQPPRYGSFDVEEAFAAALKRSFDD